MSPVRAREPIHPLPQMLPCSEESVMFSFLKKCFGKSSPSRRSAGHRDRKAVLRLEELEVRMLLTAKPDFGFTAQQVRGAYGFTNIPSFTAGSQTVPADGRGQTIAIIDAGNDPNIVADVATFSTAFSLPQMDGQNGHPWFHRVNQTGGSTLPSQAPVNW